MHDAVAAERVGTPAIGIMTDAFVSGADLMASALGFDGYRYAVIDHPIASATDFQLAERAESVIRQAGALFAARMEASALGDPVDR